MRLKLYASVLLASCAVPACVASDDGTDESGAAVSILTPLFADAKALDLGDLSRVGVGFATQALNDQLSAGPVSATFEPPTVFAQEAQSNQILEAIDRRVQIQSLDTIVSGLAARFGEKELSTEVNKQRLAHLKKGQDKYFVESAFTVDASLFGGWSFAPLAADPLKEPSTGSLGFDAGGKVSSRVILAASDDNVKELVKAPLAAAKSMREFVLPRSIDDILKMKPGEMFALQGSGRLGANLGLGAPVLIAEPVGGLLYRVVVSVGASAIVTGQLDVQVVRLDNNEVVVDVGVENGTTKSLTARVGDGFGIKGICMDGLPCLRDFTLAGQNVSLQKIVNKAVEDRLNKYLSNARAGRGMQTSRVSLSRFRFHLDQGDKVEVGRALERVLKFDVRLAQAMYNRDLDQANPAVIAEFDAVRAATTTHRDFGFQGLGMNIFQRAIVNKEGSFSLQTPDGVRSILFESIENHSALFQRGHDYKGVGIAAQTLDPSSPRAFKSEANIFLQTAISDTSMDDDRMIDAIDGLIGSVAGQPAVEALDKVGSAMQLEITKSCPVVSDPDNGSRHWDEACNVALLQSDCATTPDPDACRRMGTLRVEGERVANAISAPLGEFKDLVLKAAKTRVALQSVLIHNMTAVNGPKAAVIVDVHLDNHALHIFTHRQKQDYRAAVVDYLASVNVDRKAVPNKQAARDGVEANENWRSHIDAMADIFESRSREYQKVVVAEGSLTDVLPANRFVAYPLGIRFAVDNSAAGGIGETTVSSTSYERSRKAEAILLGLQEEAKKLRPMPGLFAEEAVLFPVMAMVSRNNLEVALDIQADTSSSFWADRKRFQAAGFVTQKASAKGPEVSLISAGMFDLQAILNGN